VRSQVKFVDVLTGLTFVNVVSLLLSLAVALVSGVGLILPGDLGDYLRLLSGLVYLVFSLIYSIYFLMGLFDVGFLWAILLSFFAGGVLRFVDSWLVALVQKLHGS